MSASPPTQNCPSRESRWKRRATTCGASGLLPSTQARAWNTRSRQVGGKATKRFRIWNTSWSTPATRPRSICGERESEPAKPESAAGTKTGPELKEMTDAKETAAGHRLDVRQPEAQFHAEAVGTIANILWVFPTSLVFFGVYGLVIGNRVKREVEIQGLDIHEMGVAGYIDDDPKTRKAT